MQPLSESSLCDIAFYGPFSRSEQETLVSAIGEVEFALYNADWEATNYWACYCARNGDLSALYVSCSALEVVLKAPDVEGMAKLMRERVQPA